MAIHAEFEALRATLDALRGHGVVPSVAERLEGRRERFTAELGSVVIDEVATPDFLARVRELGEHTLSRLLTMQRAWAAARSTYSATPMPIVSWRSVPGQAASTSCSTIVVFAAMSAVAAEASQTLPACWLSIQVPYGSR